MQKTKVRAIYLLAAAVSTFILMIVLTKLNLAECFIIGLQVYTLLSLLNEIGYSICFFRFLAFYSVFDTLLMPIVGYNVFNRGNEYASTWGIFMRVPENVYYAFMIPANIALIIGMEMKTKWNNRESLQKMLDKLRANPDNATIGVTLTVVGFLSTLLQNVLPQAFAFLIYLLMMLKYVGPLYIYYSNFRYRKLALFASIALFLVQSIIQGLFGEFAMYLVLMFIIISVELNLRFINKLAVLVVAVFLVLVLQSVKRTYRQITWLGKEVEGLSIKSSSHTDIFISLFFNKIQDVESLLDEGSVFFLYTRMNQGYLISRVMNYVPRVEGYANGSTIAKSLAAIVVPRLLWADKPEAGGRENLSRFMGIKKRHRFSMNIGPYGEAYGNFGPVYGILFILVYGAVLAVILNYVIRKALATPSLLLWLPLLFFYTITVETDILTTLNSFVKAMVFVFVVYFAARRFFGVSP